MSQMPVSVSNMHPDIICRTISSEDELDKTQVEDNRKRRSLKYNTNRRLVNGDEESAGLMERIPNIDEDNHNILDKFSRYKRQTMEIVLSFSLEGEGSFF